MSPYSVITALILLNVLFGGGIACLVGLAVHQRQRVIKAERAARKAQRRLIALHADQYLGAAVDQAILDAIREDQP